MARPKRATRRARPTPATVDQYKVILRAAMSHGYVAVAPQDDGSLQHFLKLRCVCGEVTQRDVCLLAPTTASCTHWYGPLRVIDACHPKCINDGHLVRKCECGRLGSVEVTAEMIEDEEEPTLMICCIGYTPVAYAAGSGWAAATTTGEQIEVYYSSLDSTFTYLDEESGESIVVGVVDFDLVKA